MLGSILFFLLSTETLAYNLKYNFSKVNGTSGNSSSQIQVSAKLNLLQQEVAVVSHGLLSTIRFLNSGKLT
jgi:hypothetical protein